VSFDTKCYELAEYFVSDREVCRGETINELAQLIQDTIEDFLCGDEEPEPSGSRDRDEWLHEAAEQQRLK
jgi:hypothetical protein